ncbi:MAG TPA: zinc-binding alcohol dehydrogenase family protein [Phycisphaerae bacterium]|nr:zinc-binding alcohol dehydrogenase family protein [Phycisphaerae bacterium]
MKGLALMKTLTLQEPGRLVLSDAPRPSAPRTGEALVRVHRVGVCGTDMHAFGGKQPFFSYPRILGHELGVEVLAVGTGVTNVKEGDRCSVEPYMNCEACIACRRGRGNCCVNMKVLGVHSDGGMREAFVLPARKLHRAGGLTYDQIALVETLAIGAHAVERAQVHQGENILVIGAGPIGLSVIQFAAARGRVMVMDMAEERLAFCREKLGIADTVNAREEPQAAIRELTHGEMPTAVFDATGSAGSMMGALRYVAHGGRLVYVGLFQGDFTLSDPEFHRRETTLLATRNALPEDFSRIIGMMGTEQISTAPWITHRASADGVAETFPTWAAPGSGVLKAMIEF